MTRCGSRLERTGGGAKKALASRREPRAGCAAEVAFFAERTNQLAGWVACKPR
jgi:hypothetical protein